MEKISTKIYEAYRFPKERLDDFVQFIDETLLPEIFDYGLDIYSSLKKEYIEEIAEKKGIDDMDLLESTKREAAFEHLIQKGINSEFVNTYDLVSSYNFWIKGDYVYTIPYNIHHLDIDVDYPDYVEDYSYWNNTDKPEDVSEEEWEKRKKVWKDINNNWDKNRLVHEIMTGSGNRWYQLLDYVSRNYKENN